MNIFLHYQERIFTYLKILEKKGVIKIPKKFTGLAVELPPKNEKASLEKEVVINTGIAKIEISSTEFKKLVEKITRKNMFRSYPNINDIPD